MISVEKGVCPYIYGKDYPYLVKTAGEAHDLDRVIKDFTKSYLFIASPLGLRPGQKILDIGAGLGAIGHYLKFGGIKTVSLDINSAALQKGAEIFGYESHYNQRLCADIVSLPFTRVFDCVFSQDVLEHMPSEQVISSAFREMERVCKAGKMFHKITTLDNSNHINADPSHFIKWSIVQWEDWFKSFGWSVSHPASPLISLLNKRNSQLPSYNEESFLLTKLA